MAMWRANPVGVGLNRFRKEIGDYSSHKGYDAHNFYVLTLAECGPFGLLSLMFLIWTLFRLAQQFRQSAPVDDHEARALSLGFTVTTLCMTLGAVYGSPTLEGAVMAPYWALSGLIERYMYLKNQGTAAQPSRDAAVHTGQTLSDRFPLAPHILPGRRA
jgi:O-antigen ligase